MMKANAGSGKHGGDNDAGAKSAAGSARAQTGAPLAPAIVLVQPQLGENIGFAARAMANFGLKDLRLVAPRDGWPNDKASAAAAGAAALVDQARVFDSVEAAIGDLHYVLATTARPREMVKEVLSPETAAATLQTRALDGLRTGVMFGAERSGLDNDAIVLADAILTAPVSPDFASLSLPQAVLLLSYEWLKCQRPRALGRVTAFDGPAMEGTAAPDTRPATRAELFGLFDHLESELDRSGFLKPPEKRPSMVRSIRNMFHRMAATDQDVRTWRGIVAALTRR
ncbi:MAG TPA: RNA methyltransferase [Methyloceanibacter sp.]|nr:RNA methyltransferase [Methyloceanibacter sp.]